MPLGTFVMPRPTQWNAPGPVPLLLCTLWSMAAGLWLASPHLSLTSLIIVLGSPVVEEVIFRDALWELLRGRRIAARVSVSGLAFGAAHALWVPATMALAIAIAGAGFGLVRHRYGLLAAIAAHGAANALLLHALTHVPWIYAAWRDLAT